MKKNMGSADRVIRLIIAAVIAVLYFTHIITGTLGMVLLILAIVFLATCFIGVCPLYLPFNLHTKAKAK